MEPRLRIGAVWGLCAAVSLCAGGARGQQIAKLTADDAALYDSFGWAVSLSGNTALVGAKEDDDGGEDSGSAYVFREIGGSWRQVAKLTAADAAPEDQFGQAASLSGDTALVGAWHSDERGLDSGSAYLFREVGGVWQQIAELVGDDTISGDEFGAKVAVSGDTAVIGAGRFNAAHTAYIFRETDGVWEQVARLRKGYAFGCDVAISDETAIIGAQFDGAWGAAYVFRDIAGAWEQIARLAPDDPANWYEFGSYVATGGDTAAVAAYIDEADRKIGAAYVFREIGGEWQQVAKLVADDAADEDYVGIRLAIEGDTVAMAAVADDDMGQNSGSIYIFRESGGAWEQIAKLTADDGRAYDYFGSGLSMDGDRALVGAFSADSPVYGSGSAYLFELARPCAADFNGDGSVNTLDVLGFLNAWAAGDSSADFNGDGTVNTLDVLAFLNAWTAGC